VANATAEASVLPAGQGRCPQRADQSRQPPNEEAPDKCHTFAFRLSFQFRCVAGGIPANHRPGLLVVTSRPENTQGQLRTIFAGGLPQTGKRRREITHAISS